MSYRLKAMLFIVLTVLCLQPHRTFAQATVKEAPAASPIESVVPADSLVFVQVKNLTGISDGFAKTAVSQTIDQLELLSAGREFLRSGLRFLVAYVTETPYDQVWKMLDKGFAVVLINPKDQFTSPGVAIVADVSGDRSGFETMLNGKVLPRLKALPRGGALETADAHGITIHKFGAQGKDPLCLAMIGDTFVVGAEPAVKALAGVSKGQAPSIASLAAYQSARQSAPVDAGAFVYLNLAAVYAMQEEEWQAEPDQKIKLDAVGLTGIQNIAVGLAFEGAGVREKIFLATGKEKTGLLKHFAEQPAKAPTSVALVPQGFSVYAAAQGGEGEKLYQALKELVRQIQGEEGLQKLQATEMAFQQNAQVDVEQDIFGSMGSEAFVAADLRKVIEAAGTRNPQFSDLQFIVGAETKDIPKLEGSLAQIFLSPFFVNQGIAVNKVQYKNADLSVLADPRRPELSITYAFLDRFILLANSTETMKRVVDAREAKQSLATSESFTQVSKAMAPESNLIAYLDTKSVLPAVMALVAQKAPMGFRPFLPALQALADRMTGMGIQLSNAPDGVKGEALSPVGVPFWIVSLGSLGNLAKPPVQRKIGQTNRAFGRTEWAIRRFRDENGRYPTTLAELVPQYLKKVPADPFSPNRADLGYVLLAGAGAPAAPAGERPSPQTAAFLLISIGPDGKQDMNPQDQSIPAMVKKAESQDPADVAWFKSKVYQFRKEVYPDKRALNDTGDIVRPGR